MIKSLFIVCCVLTFGAQSWAKDSPKYVRVTFQKDSTTSVAFAWNTDSPNTKTMVEYGPTTAYGRFVNGRVFMANGSLKATHEAVLTQLLPDTLYHYRVGAPNDWSSDHTFKTTPKDVCKPFVFTVMGDDRSDDNYGPSNKWHPILEEAITEHPYFAFNTGDIVHTGTDVGQWIHLLEASAPLIADTPLMTCLGNHDPGPGQGDSANYNQVFNLPRNNVTNTEDFYYFTTSTAIFVSLSTETFKGGDPKFSVQADWLDKVLTDNPRMWKFVFFHRPCYTSHGSILGRSIGHPPNEVGQNQAFTRVFDKHHVDIVFNGHNHWYERIGPLKGNGNASEGIPVNDPSKGTIYIITGGAGALTYQLVLSLFCPGTAGSKVCSDKYHYVSVTINYNKLDVNVWETKQQLTGYSNSNHKLIDQFEIVKPVPDSENPCLATADRPAQPDNQSDNKPDQAEVSGDTQSGSVSETTMDSVDSDLHLDSRSDITDVEDAEVVLDLMTDTSVDKTIEDTGKPSGQAEKGKAQPSGGCSQGKTPAPWAIFLVLMLLLAVRQRKHGN